MESFQVLKSSQEFFKDKVEDSAKRVGSKLPDHLQFYLVSLLSSLSSQEASIQEPVFDKFKLATEALPAQKIKHYRDMGDTGLVVSGVFPEIANKRNVTIDYYVDMGKIGYSGARDISEKVYRNYNIANLYHELCDRFKEVKTVLSNLDFKSERANVLIFPKY